MQELRFVLIIVGALAIAALLFHGLWTSRKDGKAKFGNKPLSKLEKGKKGKRSSSARAFLNEGADVEAEPAAEHKLRKEPAFSFDTPADSTLDPLDPLTADPLIDSYDRTIDELDNIPDFSAVEEESSYRAFEPQPTAEPQVALQETIPQAVAEEPQLADDEPELEVIVLNVHCAGKEPFVGTKLFDSMKQNGLLYGEMDIFHRHADLSGTGKVLFSVANMMHPGTLVHNDPAEFTTKGISFFMTLPGFGDPEQNFKVMLRTAQQIADELGGNVLDEKRNLMTPDRLAQYRQQIKEFKATTA